MHKMLLNSLTLEFTITPDGPILIKSGTTLNAQAAEGERAGSLMEFVSARHPRDGKPTIYLPGSSLKGVIRSYAEQIIRSCGHFACEPPAVNGGCHDSVPDKASGPETYRGLCDACRIFGSTKMAGHFRIADAYPRQAVTLGLSDRRTQVAIDRRSGGVGEGPFTLEVSTKDNFEAKLELRNFERWQIGLLALVLRDIGAGEVRIGFGKTRGLGKVKLALKALTLSYVPSKDDALPITQYLYGVGSLKPEIAEAYDFTTPDVDTLGAVVEAKRGSFPMLVGPVTTPETIWAILEAQVPAWASRAGIV